LILPYGGPVIDEKELSAALEVWQTLKFTSGKKVSELEDVLARYFATHSALCTSSGSSANLLIIAALKSHNFPSHLHDKDLVLTSPLTFSTTIFPLIQHNLIPVFIDIDVTLNFNLKLVEEVLQVENIKMILALHTLGNPINMDYLVKLVEENNILLIEDACDSFGCLWSNRKVGSFGLLSSLSFYPAHHITSCGEGGAILINNKTLDNIVRRLRDWGRACICKVCQLQLGEQCQIRFAAGYDRRFQYLELGYNARMTEVEAVVILEQFKKLENFEEQRMANIQILNSYFQHSTEFKTVKVLPKAKTVWFGYPIIIREDSNFSPKELMEYLRNEGIETRQILSGNIVRHPVFRNVQFKIFNSLQHADYVMKKGLFLPCWHGLNERDMKYIVEKVKVFVEEHE